MVYDLIVVGTGFASTFFLKKYLERQSRNVKVLVLERGKFESQADRDAAVIQYQSHMNPRALWRRSKMDPVKPVKLRDLPPSAEYVNAIENTRATPLHIAAHFGVTEIAEILIENGANVNAVMKNGTTPLMQAEMRDAKDIMELLIKHGAQK